MSKSKSIICLDNGQIFQNAKACCDYIFGDEKTLRKACTGKLETYKGKKWAYLEDHNDRPRGDIHKVGTRD
jgi:ABC-type antimicrobial peptide transport system ATPase subunit